MTKFNRKLILAYLGVGVMSLSTISCDVVNQKVGIFIYDETDTFISAVADKLELGLQNEMETSLSYNIYYAENSQNNQNTQIINYLEQSPSLLLVNAVDRLASGAIIEKCEESGTGLIFFNREPLESDMEDAENAYYVGSNPEDLGHLQALMAADLFGTPTSLNPEYDTNGDNIIQLVILKGEQGHQDAEKRTSSLIATLNNLGYQIELLVTKVNNWRRQEAYASMTNIYDTYGEDIELICSNNDDMALGAIDYLLEHDIFQEGVEINEQPFIILGVDATNVGLEAIRNNYMYGTVLNDSTRQAEAILGLTEYILGKKDFADFPYTFTNSRYIYVRGKSIIKADLEE